MRAQRLTRSLTDRVLGGVCGGIAALIGINAWWVRAAFAAVVGFTLGTGALIYLALWLLIPPQRLASIPTGRDHVQMRAVQRETVILLGVAVIAIGLIVLARNLGVLITSEGDIFAPVVVIAFGLVFLVKQLRRTA
jgi:phage shock protein PspC (stress-responsive transcriptional regulator)